MNLHLRRYWRLLSRYVRPLWPQVLLMGLLLVATIALQLTGPQIQRAFIDTALAGGEMSVLVTGALLFIGVAIVTQLVAVLDSYLAESVGWSATNSLRADVALHCLRLDRSFHDAHTPGELVERIDGDVTVLANFFSRLVIHVLGNALLMVGVLVLLAMESWIVGLASAAFALVVLVAMLRLYARARPLWAQVQQTQALFFGFLTEHVAGTEDLRANGAERYVERRLIDRVREWFPLYLRAVFAEQRVWMVALSLFAAAETVAFGLGYTLVRGGAISAGTVFLMYRYVVLLSRPVGQIQAQIQNLQQAGASIGRIEELLGTSSRVFDRGGRSELPAGPLSVELEGVSFAYSVAAPSAGPGTLRSPGPLADSASFARAHQGSALDPVLRDVSCRLGAGRTLGLLGRTGSGKSSLARLLVRSHDPVEGSVRLGGVDVREVGLAELRRRVGMVTQEVQLFNAPVRDNLTFFDPSVPDAQLLEAIDALGLTPWLESLPSGLDTGLGPTAGLSAGQAQLLALVRVFLRDPGLVVLDEASSRLDPTTERLVRGAIERMLHGRTAVVIAHRLETIQRVDEIAVLAEGRLVEHGPPAALAADPTSHYARLLRTGLGTEDAAAVTE